MLGGPQDLLLVITKSETYNSFSSYPWTLYSFCPTGTLTLSTLQREGKQDIFFLLWVILGSLKQDNNMQFLFFSLNSMGFKLKAMLHSCPMPTLCDYCNKTIKDGDIAPWKDVKKLNKDKRKEQRNNYILIWGGSSCVSIFFPSAFAPSALRPCECRICRCYEGFGLLLILY